MRRSNIKRGTLVASAAAAMLLMAQASQAHIATISGGYDLNAYDTPELLFNNTSVYDFNGAQMVLTGYQGLNNGQTNTVALGNITSGSVLDVIWGGALPQQSP